MCEILPKLVEEAVCQAYSKAAETRNLPKESGKVVIMCATCYVTCCPSEFKTYAGEIYL